MPLGAEGFDELGDGHRRAFLVDDEPQVGVGPVGVVGEAAQGWVGERVRPQDDEVADALGAQVHVDEPPQRLAGSFEADGLAQRGEHASGEAADAVARRRFADDLAERSGVQAPQANEGVDIVVGVQADCQGAVSGPRHRARRRRCGSTAHRARGARSREQAQGCR